MNLGKIMQTIADGAMKIWKVGWLMLLRVTMMSINPDKITMLKTYETSIEVIDEWFRLLSKREKIIVLAMHNKGHTVDFRNVKNMELVLMSGIPPKRRYVENGVPCADYPSFDEIKDSELITIWDSLSIEKRQILFSVRCKGFC